MQTTAERTWGSDRAKATPTFTERTLPTNPYAPQSNPDRAIDQSDLFTSILKQ